ncbi:DNA (cytosine-5-)-methyltransferase [Dionaea muscipula]
MVARVIFELYCSVQVFQMSKSAPSDSLDSLFYDGKDAEITSMSVDVLPKEEAVLLDEIDYEKRASLLMMNFPVKEVDYAIGKLGASAPINELVDFIIAFQMAENEETESPDPDHKGNNVDGNTEVLFWTMDKTLRLLELGFTEHEVSLAIEKFGPEVPIAEIADWLCSGQFADLSSKITKGLPGVCKLEVKLEEPTPDFDSHTKGMNVEELYWGKRLDEEYHNSSSSLRMDFDLDDIKGKKVKQEYDDLLSVFEGPMYKRAKKGDVNLRNCSTPRRKIPDERYEIPKPNACRSLDAMVAKPPYFLYGNVLNLSHNCWNKMSHFLYAVGPEFVHTQFFSALNRKEGYIHNLPMEGRFHIHPTPPMTIEAALPHTKKWWPSWDTRKQLNCISSETMGISQVCDNLGKMLKDSRGILSTEQQAKVIHHCRTLNLVWVGQHKLAPIEPEHLERILGYPPCHTQGADVSLLERLESLRNCFQIDTIGYHVSVLKSLFPDGLTMLSIFSGIGGVEIALHRLGIRLKAVVSVETSEMKRKILWRWWKGTDQTGELVQIEDVEKLTSSRLELLMKKFGGFDFIVCQNPCTYSSKGSSNMVGGSNDVTGFDFTLFYEFVRVLQRVRGMVGRKR